MAKPKTERTLGACIRCPHTKILSSRKLCPSCDTQYYKYRYRTKHAGIVREISVREFILEVPIRKTAGEASTLLSTSFTEHERVANLFSLSPSMRIVAHKAMKAAARNINVLIEGESGVGKEIIARAIHNLSLRKDRPFVIIDCPSLTPDLASSELFGHEKGAFTGSRDATKGLFGEADGGTVFIDELAALDTAIQPKLLRVLETMTLRRLGGTAYRPIDVRVISATNIPLRVLVEDGRFRIDLLYRLNTFPIRIPPLRERKEEILPLAQRFIAQASGQYIRLSNPAQQIMTNYSWPGNVRELKHAMEYACTVNEGRLIQEDDLPESILSANDSQIGMMQHM